MELGMIGLGWMGTHYRRTSRRRAPKRDVGMSGGVWRLDRRYCRMIGGDQEKDAATKGGAS